MNIYSYINYINIINFKIKSNVQIYGYKAQLAQAAGCQRSYLSQVLKETHHLTLEHAWGLSEFWKFSSVERDYFLDLVQYARAGTPELKTHYKQKIVNTKQDQENLAKRIKDAVSLPDQTLSQFYSHWYYLAILIALTIPELRNSDALGERLGLSKSMIQVALQQLISMGLVIQQDNKYFPTVTSIHTPRESLFNALNHQHWRNKAVENALLNNDHDIHYTLVCSLSLEDVEKIRQLVFQWIDESRKTIAPSNEEELYALNLDWFKV